MRLFVVTGTDTGVGKTFVTARLIRSLRDLGTRAIGLKPVETGWSSETSDAAQLASASSRTLVETVWSHFELPAAPAVAAAESHHPLDISEMISWIRAAASTADVCLVEGAGGWLVPFGPQHLFSDVVRELEPEAVLVVGSCRLGTINHTLLTAEAVTKVSPLAGIALSRRPGDDLALSEWSYREIQKRVASPVWFAPRDDESMARTFHVEHQAA